MAFRNSPNVKNEDGSSMYKKYIHQPLTIEHFGLHASIRENGRVNIVGIPDKDTGEYDEIEVPASFIFKLVNALEMTRTVEIKQTEEKK